MTFPGDHIRDHEYQQVYCSTYENVSEKYAKLNIIRNSNASLSQYATTYEYYFVVKVKPSAKVLNLGRMTTAQIEQIAKRNGWFDDIERIKTDPKILDNDRQPMERKLLKKPGGFFYACMDYLANKEKKSWSRMLKGIDAVVDPGYGIIAKGEESQMIVLNPAMMIVIEQGDNKDNSDRVYAELMKGVAEKFHGKFYYLHKRPTIEIEINGSPVKAAMDSPNRCIHFNFFQDGFETYHLAKFEDNHEATVDWLVSKINYEARNAQPSGLGLSWNYKKIIEVIRELAPKAGFFRHHIRNNEYNVSYDNGRYSLLWFYVIIAFKAHDAIIKCANLKKELSRSHVGSRIGFDNSDQFSHRFHHLIQVCFGLLFSAYRHI